MKESKKEMYSERGIILLLLAIRIEINITLNILHHFRFLTSTSTEQYKISLCASVATNSMPYITPYYYLYPRIKMHGKMVLIGLHITTNTDRTNELLAAPTDRRDTKYY